MLNSFVRSSFKVNRHTIAYTFRSISTSTTTTRFTSTSTQPFIQAPIKMPDSITVTFLGTAAGRPSTTRNTAGRNVSCLAMKLDNKL